MIEDVAVRETAAPVGPLWVNPGDPDWDVSRQAFNLAYDQRPERVARPRTVAEVSEVVRLAVRDGLRVAPQRTGHGAGPLGSLRGTVLLRTDLLRGVEIDASACRATVLAGARWDEVVPEAALHGLRPLHGTAPDVGVVGYTLGGGMSWYARRYGLASGHVTALDVVGADGVLRRVDADRDPDLFWALRGGMGNFGVVCRMEFGLQRIPEVYAGALFFGVQRAKPLLRAWRDWVETVPDEVTSLWRMLKFPNAPAVPKPFRGKSMVQVEAAIIGPERFGSELIAPLRRLGAELDTFAPSSSERVIQMHMDPQAPLAYSGTSTLLDDLTPAAIDRLLSVIGPGSGSELMFYEVRHLGGALTPGSPSAGALSGVPGKFSAVGGGPLTDAQSARRLSDCYAMIGDALSGVAGRLTPNFAIKPVDPSRFYDADVVDRLRAIRGERDPDGVFRAAHEIG